MYSGITVAPWSGIHETGWRVRFAGGYGQYSTKGTAEYQVPAVAGPSTVDVAYRIGGRVAYADVLAGYLWRLGPLTAKAFVGASLIDHGTTSAGVWPTLLDPQGVPYGLDVALEGSEIGVKTALELWLNIGQSGWASLDLNWTSAHDTYSARIRTAWRAWPTVSLGVEGIVNGNRQHPIGQLATKLDFEDIERRAGLFARYEWFGGEISLASGISTAPDENLRPYATLNWITQF